MEGPLLVSAVDRDGPIGRALRRGRRRGGPARAKHDARRVWARPLHGPTRRGRPDDSDIGDQIDRRPLARYDELHPEFECTLRPVDVVAGRLFQGEVLPVFVPVADEVVHAALADDGRSRSGRCLSGMRRFTITAAYIFWPACCDAQAQINS